MWNRGARDDWDYLSTLTSSPAFAWENVKEGFDDIEKVHNPGYTDGRARYVSPNPARHGTEGPVDVEYAAKWEKHIEPLLHGAEEFGWKINPDVNSGDPTGVGLGPSTARDGVRVTARTAYLDGLAWNENVEIRMGWQVARVVVEEGRAVGVEGLHGEKGKQKLVLIGCKGEE